MTERIYSTNITREYDGETLMSKDMMLTKQELWLLLGKLQIEYGCPMEIHPKEEGRTILEYFRQTRKGVMTAYLTYSFSSASFKETKEIPHSSEIEGLLVAGVLRRGYGY